ncbi:hypothetical protein [Vibrio celticus]|uniref:Uncharacterized protein n=1 Tax=Vibrio celticus TaxID=446372 RepID=A0A1C3JK03_9VIBR|nr:hypothetical protein [Vibrio celticus]SBT15464.1 hypothetical protein VCE7224_04253 [Vibrio celticus]
MFYKRLLVLALPLTFVFPIHAETFSERMARIEQENVLAKTMSEEQVELIAYFGDCDRSFRFIPIT